MMFLSIFDPHESKSQAKTTERCSFLHFTDFPFDLPSGLDFGPSWAPFLVVLAIFFKLFSLPMVSKDDQQIIDFTYQFF